MVQTNLFTNCAVKDKTHKGNLEQEELRGKPQHSRIQFILHRHNSLPIISIAKVLLVLCLCSRRRTIRIISKTQEAGNNSRV